MSVAIQNDAPPLRQDASGALRVGQTRVLLETVISDFLDGATPEAIVQHYPALALSDVYGVVWYYLRHREEIDRYMNEREETAQDVRQRVESRQPDLSGIRQRLLAQREPRG